MSILDTVWLIPVFSKHHPLLAVCARYQLNTALIFLLTRQTRWRTPSPETRCISIHKTTDTI